MKVRGLHLERETLIYYPKFDEQEIEFLSRYLKCTIITKKNYIVILGQQFSKKQIEDAVHALYYDFPSHSLHQQKLSSSLKET